MLRPRPGYTQDCVLLTEVFIVCIPEYVRFLFASGYVLCLCSDAQWPYLMLLFLLYKCKSVSSSSLSLVVSLYSHT